MRLDRQCQFRTLPLDLRVPRAGREDIGHPQPGSRAAQFADLDFKSCLSLRIRRIVIELPPHAVSRILICGRPSAVCNMQFSIRAFVWLASSEAGLHCLKISRAWSRLCGRLASLLISCWPERVFPGRRPDSWPGFHRPRNWLGRMRLRTARWSI